MWLRHITKKLSRLLAQAGTHTRGRLRHYRPRVCAPYLKVRYLMKLGRKSNKLPFLTGDSLSEVRRSWSLKRRDAQYRIFGRLCKDLVGFVFFTVLATYLWLSKFQISIFGIFSAIAFTAFYTLILANIRCATKHGFIFYRVAIERRRESPFYFWFYLFIMLFFALAPFLLLPITVSR